MEQMERIAYFMGYSNVVSLTLRGDIPPEYFGELSDAWRKGKMQCLYDRMSIGVLLAVSFGIPSTIWAKGRIDTGYYWFSLGTEQLFFYPPHKYPDAFPDGTIT